MEKAIPITAVDVTKHSRSTMNLSATLKDRQQFANAAGDCIYKQSPGEFDDKLKKEFEHQAIIALALGVE